MSVNLLANMKNEISSRSPLKQEILLRRTSFDKIFVFEGIDDFPVYDEWMKRNPIYACSGHLIAKGKRQIIELYENAIKNGDDEILLSCYFFVDHDYDTFAYNSECFVTLACYSIENYIINLNSVMSYVKDEFKMDITWSELFSVVKSDFEDDFSSFNKIAKELCKPLFVNHNSNEKAKFYDKISRVINIEYKNIKLKDDADIIDFEVDKSSPEVISLIKSFEELPFERMIKGKYVFEFIKLWLLSLKKHLTSYTELKITKDPLMLERRRLAGATTIPEEIRRFS